MALTLDDLLAACSKASGLTVGRVTPAHVDLARALAQFPALETEARHRLAAIHPSVLDRDHISRWLKTTLEQALPGESP